MKRTVSSVGDEVLYSLGRFVREELHRDITLGSMDRATFGGRAFLLFHGNRHSLFLSCRSLVEHVALAFALPASWPCQHMQGKYL